MCKFIATERKLKRRASKAVRKLLLIELFSIEKTEFFNSSKDAEFTQTIIRRILK